MTLAFEFHPQAQAEFAADIEWYDNREPGVGGRFADRVRAAVEAAVDDPEAFAPWPDWDAEPTVRAKSVNGFPYRVVYFVIDDRLTILAIAHEKRRPGYWRERMRL